MTLKDLNLSYEHKHEPIKTYQETVFLRFCFLAMLIAAVLAFSGCKSDVILKDVTQENAEKAAQYINLQSGLIEQSIANLTRLAIYKIPEGEDKQPIINMVHSVSSNLFSIIKSGETNPTEIRAAFKVNEPEYDVLFSVIGEIANAKIQDLKKNGYGDLSMVVLSAISEGLKDGTTM